MMVCAYEIARMGWQADTVWTNTWNENFRLMPYLALFSAAIICHSITAFQMVNRPSIHGCTVRKAFDA